MDSLPSQLKSLMSANMSKLRSFSQYRPPPLFFSVREKKGHSQILKWRGSEKELVPGGT